MRKFLASFLLFVMVMPGTPCGLFMTAKAKAETHSMSASMPDCPGMGMDKDSGTHKSDGPTFFKDCLHVDLQTVDNHASLDKPILTSDVFTLAIANTPRLEISSQENSHEIRGPPPDWPDLSQTQPPVLLTTQRIRQ